MEKLRKGDEVIVIAGRDKGRKGLINSVLEKGERFLVEGVNLVKKTEKADPNKGKQGGIVTKSAPIHRSNVMLVNPGTQKGDRVGIRVLDDGRKVRYFKST